MNTGNSAIIGISLFTYGKQRWEEIFRNHKYISLTLNLILCQRRTLNPERINLQKRKVQHKRKRIQRKNYAKTKMQRARLTAGFIFRLCRCSLKSITPRLASSSTNRIFKKTPGALCKSPTFFLRFNLQFFFIFACCCK